MVTVTGSSQKGYTVTQLPYLIRATFSTRESACEFVGLIWDTALASALQTTRFNNALTASLARSA